MPIYLGFFDAPNVLDRRLRGDVTAKGYEGWIELSSAQLGAQRQVRNVNSSGAERTPPPKEIQVTRVPDGASTALVRAWSEGEAKMAVIAFVKDGKTYMTLVLRDAMISGYSIGGARSEGVQGMPTESFTLNFTQITYNVQDKSPDVTRQSMVKLGPWEQSTLGDEAH